MDAFNPAAASSSTIETMTNARSAKTLRIAMPNDPELDEPVLFTRPPRRFVPLVESGGESVVAASRSRTFASPQPEQFQPPPRAACESPRVPPSLSSTRHRLLRQRS